MDDATTNLCMDDACRSFAGIRGCVATGSCLMAATILPNPDENGREHVELNGEAIQALRLLAAREIRRQERRRYLYRAVPWIAPTAINAALWLTTEYLRSRGR